MFPLFPTLITPIRHQDSRGWFAEAWHASRYEGHGISAAFCQDNRSFSEQPFTIRGLHFQREPHAQAKLVQCLKGRIFDVAVDVRRSSPTFGQWIGAELSASDGRQFFIPRGYAHGFLTLEPDSEVAYKVDNFYDRVAEGGIRWDDPALGIAWPLGDAEPVLSDKDAVLPSFATIDAEFAYDGDPLRLIEVA